MADDNFKAKFDDFCEALWSQLEGDSERWGDTWESRPRAGQVQRTMDRFRDYNDQHQRGGQPFPWLKVAGGAFIGWMRDQPDWVEPGK